MKLLEYLIQNGVHFLILVFFFTLYLLLMFFIFFIHAFLTYHILDF